MTISELEDLTMELIRQIKLMHPSDRPLVVTLPGTNKSYFSTL